MDSARCVQQVDFDGNARRHTDVCLVIDDPYRQVDRIHADPIERARTARDAIRSDIRQCARCIVDRQGVERFGVLVVMHGDDLGHG